MRKKKERKPDWRRPKDPEERAKARAKATKMWPHPAGTPVWVRGQSPSGRTEWNEREAVTRTISFYDRNGHVVVFLQKQGDPERACRLTVRELPKPEPHWSDRDD